ncbi:MAG: protein kinase [Caldilineaceae bacterium]|nr:protein kinase [Caldilineaceae bacterium]
MTNSTISSPIPDHLDWKFAGKTLGSGGQGTVYVVYNAHDPNRTLRALKVLNENAPLKAKKRFQKEIQTVSQMFHPAIIKVHDYSQPHEEFQYLVMSYHEGAQTIEDLCLSDPILNPYHGDTLKCLDLFEKIIIAINACEKANPPVYHRDISPKNILVLPDESIRLIDFGLCQTLDNNTTITMTGENVGTRLYAPLECSAGSRFSIGTHTDIYSAAKILWSAITSRVALDREADYQDHGSMREMFPNSETTWHLRRIFENTIQEDPANRDSKTATTLYRIREVRLAVSGGYSPKETVALRCPSCGIRNVKPSQSPHHLFGQFTTGRYSMSECQECGFIIVRRYNPTN